MSAHATPVRYFDTSFLVPLILPEATSEPISAFFEDLSHEDLAVSDWTRVEFASLLAREVRMGSLPPLGCRSGIVGVREDRPRIFRCLLAKS